MADIPNYSKEIEMAMVGCCLIDNSILDQIDTEPDHFFNTGLRTIFRTMREMRSRGQAIDFITLPDELNAKNVLHDLGGYAGIAKLTEYSGPTYNYATYAERLAELYDARRTREIANELVQKAVSGENPEQVAAYAMSQLSRIGKRGKGAVHISDWHHRTKRKIAERRNRPASEFALRSGYSDLDNLIGYLYPEDGTMVYLIADAGMGKTILMSDIARNWSRQRKGVIYEQEMSPERMMIRDYSTQSDLRASKIKAGQVDVGLLDALDDYYHGLNIFVDDGVQTLGGIRADLLRLKEEHDIAWYCLDYLSLLDAKVAGEEYQRQAHISRELMRINREVGVVGLVIHTPNKMGEMAGAQSMKHDNDITLMLDELTASEEIETFSIQNIPKWRIRKLRVTKNRDGEGGLGKIYLALLNDKPHFVQPGQEN